MFRLHQVKYFGAMLVLLFALSQIQSVVHSSDHLFDSADCQTCQIFAENTKLDLSDTFALKAVDIEVSYAVFFLVLFSIPLTFSTLTTRAPPALNRDRWNLSGENILIATFKEDTLINKLNTKLVNRKGIRK